MIHCIAFIVFGALAGLLMQTEPLGPPCVVQMECRVNGNNQPCLDWSVWQYGREEHRYAEGRCCGSSCDCSLCEIPPAYMYVEATCRAFWPCPEIPPSLKGPKVDHPTFQQCMHGPGVLVTPQCCQYDVPPVPLLVGDGDVDIEDWSQRPR